MDGMGTPKLLSWKKSKSSGSNVLVEISRTRWYLTFCVFSVSFLILENKASEKKRKWSAIEESFDYSLFSNRQLISFAKLLSLGRQAFVATSHETK